MSTVAGRVPDDILSAAKAASGGARWNAIGTLHFRGKVQVGDLHGSFESWVDLQHGYFWTDEQLSGAKTAAVRETNGWNGKVSWSADQSGDVLLSESEEAIAGALGASYVNSFGFFFRERFPARVRTRPDRSLAGKRYRIVQATPHGADPVELWVDAASQHIEQVHQLKGVDKGVTVYGDFRPVQGLVLPWEWMDLGLKPGEVLMRVNLSSIEIDQAPPGSIYDPPPAKLVPIQFPTGHDSVSMDFDFKENYISIPVSIDGLPPERFLFDSGSTNTLTPAFAQAKGLEFDAAGVSWGGGAAEAATGMRSVNRIDIGSLGMTNQVIGITAIPMQQLSGILGYELARSAVVQIDYAARRITFMKPDSFRKPDHAVAMPVRFASSTEPLVEASVNGKRGEFQLDTGQDTGLSVNRPFAERTGLMGKYRSGSRGASEGVGGQEETIEFTPASFEIGGMRPWTGEAQISLADIGSGAEEHVAGGIGNGILRQFTVTLDYFHRMAYFERNSSFGKPPDDEPIVASQTLSRPKSSDGSGWLGLVKLGLPDGKSVQVLALDPEGPAARGGIAEGDWIVAINGQPIEKLLKPFERNGKVVARYLGDESLRFRPGTEVTLMIKRGEGQWTVKLVAVP